MALNTAKLSIVGCGPGSSLYVTEAARRTVSAADVVAGGKRLLELFPDCGAERIVVDAHIAAVLEQIAARRAAGRRVAVLVSGDPGLHSLAQNVIRHFGRGHCEVIPAVSSVQMAFARLGLDWADARILSAHGRIPTVEADELRSVDKIAILAGTADALRWSAEMATALKESHAAFLAENLTLDNERFQQVTAEQLGTIEAASLSIVLLIREATCHSESLTCHSERSEESPNSSEILRCAQDDCAQDDWETFPTKRSMNMGTLYGIGVGPGDPEWITVKAARVLGACRHVCVPRSDAAADSVALEIARVYLRPDAVIHELSFPMTADASVLEQHWRAAAREVHGILTSSDDCCFLTLGDALLYSTYIYLLRELQAIDPAIKAVTIPGITAFSAAAALANRPIGEGKQLVTIVPASDDFSNFTDALDRGGAVVLMKVGRRLEKVLDELESRNLLDQTVFVSHAGLPQQHVETDVRRLRGLPEKAGYLSIMIIQP